MNHAFDRSDPQEGAEQTAETLYFDAELTPHRSLSPRGFLFLMSAICGLSFAAGFGFFLAGAWPVVGFLGADVLLIYLAFRINYRRGRMRETLRLTRDLLTVQRFDCRGRTASWKFEPTWLQVLTDAVSDDSRPLVLRSHGNSVAIGAFLTPEERGELAAALQEALQLARSAPRADPGHMESQAAIH